MNLDVGQGLGQQILADKDETVAVTHFSLNPLGTQPLILAPAPLLVQANIESKRALQRYTILVNNELEMARCCLSCELGAGAAERGKAGEEEKRSDF